MKEIFPFKINVLHSNYYYRYGDAVLRDVKHCRKHILNDPRFSGSLLNSYFSNLKNPMQKNNYDRRLFREVVNDFMEKKSEIESRSDTLYINIRTGDIVQIQIHRAKSDRIHEVGARLKDLYLFNHKMLISKIEEFLKKNSMIKKISFITAMHFGNAAWNNDWMYNQQDELTNYELMGVLYRKIQEKFPGISVDLEVNSSAERRDEIDDYSFEIVDEDFLKLCKSDNLIFEEGFTASGFGKMISDVRVGGCFE